jgi:mannose-6-phosphate isomerase-like protein (cupin superfamily)
MSQSKTILTKVSLSEKFSLFQDHYSPKIVGELNDSYVKVVKLQGEFVWHHHDNEDEMFLVVKGCLVMGLQEAGGIEREITIDPGEFIIIPKGVEHKPRADEETHIVLLEPKSTLNTGNIRSARTVEQLEKI